MQETRYHTGALLGRGGMAEVYAGIDRHLGRPVAIKRLREDRSANPTLRARFRREASAAASLNHPGIVAVLDTAEIEPSTGAMPIPIIVMELVDGCSLAETLRDGTRLAPDRALEITAAILDALAASHTAGIIHRDIKPANVLVTSTGRVKIADFGIARSISDAAATETQTATVMGSPHYMSPEQARGLSVDHRSDLYSVGCLLYELLLGQTPFTGDSPLSISYQHVAESPARPSTLDPRLSGDIDTVLMKALHKAPGDRYQSADQMRADLIAVRSGHPLPAPPAATSRAATTTATPPGHDDAHTVQRSPVADRRAHRHVPVAILVLTVLLIVGLTGFDHHRLMTSQIPVTIEVPAVLGFNRAQAESVLSNAHLVPRVRLVQGTSATIQTVTDQIPAGGELAARDNTVIIEISTGPAKAKVPTRLVGRGTASAERLLVNAGFTNVITRPGPILPDASAGTVTAVDPTEGRLVTQSTPVTITYASTRTDPTQRSTISATPVPVHTRTSGSPPQLPTKTVDATETGPTTKAPKPRETHHSSQRARHPDNGKSRHPKKTGPDANKQH